MSELGKKAKTQEGTEMRCEKAQKIYGKTSKSQGNMNALDEAACDSFEAQSMMSIDQRAVLHSAQSMPSETSQ